MLLAADDKIALSDCDLARELGDGRAGAGGRVDASGCDDAVEGYRNHDLAIAHYGHDIFVWAIRADAVRVAEAVGDALGEVAGLGLGEGVGGVCCVAVEDCIFFGEGVGRVCVYRGLEGIFWWTKDVKVHTEQESQQVECWQVNGRLGWVAIDFGHGFVFYFVFQLLSDFQSIGMNYK